MNLKQMGWNSYFDVQSTKHEDLNQTEPARVIEELKGFFRVLSASKESLAELTGAIRFHSTSRADLPAVGDWVLIRALENDRASIEAVLQRRTKLSRKASGTGMEEQILAANVDTVFIVTAANQDLNLRRIERYVALVWESGARPVILLNKADLANDISAALLALEGAAVGVPVRAVSGITGQGIEEVIATSLIAGETAVFVGSSGVGKSTIINALFGRALQPTAPVRESDDRGRHTTTSRQLFFLPSGAAVIDTPGIRELQLWDSNEGLAQAFDDIESLAANCKFRDCKHATEPGCAIQQAISDGSLDAERFGNYEKLQAEARFMEGKADIEVATQAKNRTKRLCKAAKRFYKLPENER
ncbi:MAG: putative GTPase [Acidobacteriales bacterium]|nr:putative GTPase [Terriglobales bacterium]